MHNSQSTLTPSLRFPASSGELTRKQLGVICQYKNGGSYEDRVLEDGRYDLITLNSIDIDGFLKKNHKKIDSADWYLEKGDLIMVLSDVAHGYFLGLVDIIPENNQYVLNQRMGLLRRIDKEVDIRFLRYFINKHQAYFKIHGQGSSQQNLSKGDIEKFTVMLPAYSEQQKIASFLSTVDSWLENLRSQKSALMDYKKSIMQKIFSQEIRFKDENGKDYPKWKKRKIGEVLKIGNGKDHKSLANGDIPVFGTSGLMRYVNKPLYSGETVFIGRKGTINKPFYYNGDFWTVDTLFYTYNFSGITAKFTHIVFQLINWLQYNEASGVPSLSKTTIEKIKIDLPCLDEQQKISDLLISLDRHITTKETQITETEQWKKGLMQRMFV